MAELSNLNYPTTQNQALYFVTKWSNHFCSTFLPEWMVQADRVYHHHTNTSQTYEELFATLAIYYIAIFVWTTLVDLFISRPLTLLACKISGKDTKNSKKIAWFMTHALFNMLVVVCSWDEALEVFISPMTKGFEPPRWWGSHPGALFGAIAIGAFHVHHFAFYTVSLEDVIHHLINAGLVVVIGALCPWGRFTALSNWAMCGIPGGLNYFALWAYKFGWMSRMAQKNFNRFLNICLRYPIQALVTYLLFIVVVDGSTVPEMHWLTAVTVAIGATLHTLNSLYYGDQVVGNYHVEAEATRKASKSPPTDRKKDDDKKGE